MAEGSIKPAGSPELLKLEKFKGVWVSDLPFLPGYRINGAVSGKTREEYRDACGGSCFILDIESLTPEGDLKAHGFIFYDESISKFKLEWYDNFGNHISGEGNFTDDDTLIMIEKYTRKGRGILERHTEKFKTAGAKIHTVETFINGEFSKTCEIPFKRER